MGNQTKSVFITITVIAIHLMLLVGFTTNCHANDTIKRERHSKDYREFPSNSPEAVLTAFIEADLGDIFNRGNDDRYPLWWELTELGGVPDNDGYLKLYINSYKILKNTGSNIDQERVLNLELDVRVIRISSDKKNSDKICWRSVPIHINSNKYHSTDSSFVKSVCKGTQTIKIPPSEPSYITIDNSKRIWILPVLMIKKKGKWLIAMESLPLQVAYVHSEVDWYQEQINREIATDNVCLGKRKIDNYVMEQQLDYIKKEIGHNTSKFRSIFCSANSKRSMSNAINNWNETI